MKYISTRGKAPELEFDDVMLAGLARDGGLYISKSWPRISGEEMRSWRGMPYWELATRVMLPFMGGRIDEADFADIVKDTYSGFDHAAVTPLIQLDEKLFVMELFHGPTLAFKDVAMQLLGRLYDYVLKKRGQRVTIVGATSGDTGSAALEAFKNRECVDIVILHPKGRTSEVQRRQMTTIKADNVHNIALEGTFDDCQDMVKAMFADTNFRDSINLSAVNSINWARIMAQVVYYFHAGLALGAPDRPLNFAVPTGNFGNIYAGYVARRMGVPIEKLVCGSNSNDILHRFFSTGAMDVETVVPTLSPSMDIQISSNHERLLFSLLERDGEKLTDAMTRFRSTGHMEVPAGALDRAQAIFASHRSDDAATLATMREVYRRSGWLIDPHTAVGVAAARAVTLDPSTVTVAFGCAHPAKFPDAVEKATGVRPGLPPRLADLYEREEVYTTLPNNLAVVQEFIRSSVVAPGAAA
ncbi:threonine synthase [Radicibacter daui]|uniref:threonine synthase n=1 Tax=Radicibacter daui TaxID=3064829 RepID=UPI004046C470